MPFLIASKLKLPKSFHNKLDKISSQLIYSYLLQIYLF